MVENKQILLLDASGLKIGSVDVSSIEGNLVVGDFFPTSEYTKYAEIFQEFEFAVNNILLVEVDRLEMVIKSIGFFAIEPHQPNVKKSVEDLQIMSGGVSFRWAGQDI